MTELERKIKAKIPGPDTGIEVRHTICDICSPGMHCGINAYIKDGKVIKIEGIDGHPSNDGRLCTKGLSNRQYIYREDRLLTPLKRVGKRGEGKWKAIGWDQLIKEVTEGGKLFAEIGEDREVMGFKELHDTKTPMNPDEPGLGPVSNQLVMLGSRSDGRGNFSSRFASTFGTINAYGHASS